MKATALQLAERLDAHVHERHDSGLVIFSAPARHELGHLVARLQRDGQLKGCSYWLGILDACEGMQHRALAIQATTFLVWAIEQIEEPEPCHLDAVNAYSWADDGAIEVYA